MKSKLGKITGATMLFIVAVLLVANLLTPHLTATPINPRAVPTLGNAELQGDIWYVDGNMLYDTGTGKSWADAKKYLSSAMALSNADIARDADRQWAARNTIYVRGDTITEDMVILAQKTDIIGVGSNAAFKKPGITGSWIIPGTINYMGCRFINMYFTDTGATAIFDIDAQTGLEFHGCQFESGSGGLTTIGLQVEESSFLVVDSCEFSCVSATKGFSASAIKIVNDTGVVYDVKITNNIIEAAGIGIDCDESDLHNGWVTDNYIFSTVQVIDDDGDNLRVVNNKLITSVDIDTHAEETGWDFNPNLSVGNEIIGSASEISNTIPIVEESDA